MIPVTNHHSSDVMVRSLRFIQINYIPIDKTPLYPHVCSVQNPLSSLYTARFIAILIMDCNNSRNIKGSTISYNHDPTGVLNTAHTTEIAEIAVIIGPTMGPGRPGFPEYNDPIIQVMSD